MNEDLDESWKLAQLDALERAPTLRDQFATAALGGMLGRSGANGTASAYAEKAYRLADAMMAERAKRGGGAS